jgi:hypothetical protein
MAAGKTSELRILQMYLWSLVTPKYVNGRRIGLLHATATTTCG